MYKGGVSRWLDSRQRLKHNVLLIYEWETSGWTNDMTEQARDSL